MTESEERYVAEKMLGWRLGGDDSYYTMSGDVQIAKDAFDLTDSCWLGYLWAALCEKCDKEHYDIQVDRAEGGKTAITLHWDNWSGISAKRPPISRAGTLALACIAAFKALERSTNA